MHTLRDSTGLLRCAQHSDVLQALHQPQRRVLCFHTSAVQWGQLRIKIDEVESEDCEIYVVLLRTQNAAEATDNDIAHIYRMDHAQWLSMRVTDRVYRICRLAQLLLVTDSIQPPQSEPHVPVMVIEEEEETETPVESPLPSLQVLWPHAYRTGVPVDSAGIVEYAANLCDYTLLQGPLAQSATPRLSERWLARMELYYRDGKRCYTTLAYYFAATLCRTLPGTGPLLYHATEPRWPLAREWLDFACYVFAQQRLSVEAFGSELQRHIAWIQQTAWHGFAHRWHDYRLPQTELYWEQQGSRVTVSSLWLLQCNLSGHRQTGRGCVTVESRVFLQSLLPHLYRLVLSDALHLLRHTALALAAGRGQNADYALWDGERAWYQESREALRSLWAYTGEWRALVVFNEQVAQSHSSPVMRALYKYERAEDARRKTPTAGAVRVCEAVPDIEELARVAPPCMARVLKQDWCKNGDRFNLVGWLYDAGYSQVQVVSYLCRNSAQDQERRTTVLSLYQACVKRPAEKRPSNGRVSAACGNVIDSHYGEGNVLRCPYEEAHNKGQRRTTKHERHEKSAFQAQCAGECGLIDGEVRHPLDYVQSKCLSPCHQ